MGAGSIGIGILGIVGVGDDGGGGGKVGRLEIWIPDEVISQRG